MKKTYKVAIIGGGASGLTAATVLSEKFHDNTIILERNDRLGKKIIATGNGRGNITNENLSLSNYRSETPTRFAYAITEYGNKNLIDFYSELGMAFFVENGKVFPSSLQASSILDLLRLRLNRNNCEIITSLYVDSIYKNSSGTFIIKNGKEELWAETVILSCGGKAARQFGTDGSSYKLAESFGHNTTRLLPALVQLKCDVSEYRNLKNIRVPACVSLLKDGATLKKIDGDIMWTDYGVSGDTVFKLSALFDGGNNFALSVDFLPKFSRDELTAILINKSKRNPDFHILELLIGIINKQVALAVIKQTKVLNSSITIDSCAKLASTIKNFVLKVTGTMGFDYAQVTKGGIRLNEIDAKTMESNFTKNLYIIGEMLDVDGDCGGYNLQWAFSSAMCCADAILNK